VDPAPKISPQEKNLTEGKSQENLVYEVPRFIPDRCIYICKGRLRLVEPSSFSPSRGEGRKTQPF
jgi:hypothetical protein